jgi:hypothetical protein
VRWDGGGRLVDDCVDVGRGRGDGVETSMATDLVGLGPSIPGTLCPSYVVDHNWLVPCRRCCGDIVTGYLRSL